MNCGKSLWRAPSYHLGIRAAPPTGESRGGSRLQQKKIAKTMNSSASYNDKVVRQFIIMTVVWGIIGMAVGVLIAAQLVWPALNFEVPWLSFGRLRPLHTNAMIFAFGGSALFGTCFYIVQRTCHVRLFSDDLSAFVFWGWQLVILAAVVTLPLGLVYTMLLLAFGLWTVIIPATELLNPGGVDHADHLTMHP